MGRPPTTHSPTFRPGRSARSRDRRTARALTPTCLLALAFLLTLAMPASPLATRHGADDMLEPHTVSLLVGYYETFLREQDVDAFRLNVATRYTEGTLARMATSGGSPGRRAAVLALGLVGGFQVNAVVGRALRDPDPVVRNLAQNALWAIWFRADSPENNATLQQVHDLIERGRFVEAETLATRLISRAPQFAEAYNQRAIALYALGRLAESAADCLRTLERNPYHTGALGGLGQCYLRLNDRRAALKTYQRALKIQPYSEGLRQAVAELEANP